MRLSRLLVVSSLTATIAIVLTSSTISMGVAVAAQEDSVESKPATPVAAAPVEGTVDPVIARGKYLAHDVAMCVYCHSPRGADGKPIESRIFNGALIPVATPVNEKEWASRAPNLRSIANIWGEKDLAKFLETGIVPHGGAPKLPMPQFRMNEEDALAVSKYLRSLK